MRNKVDKMSNKSNSLKRLLEKQAEKRMEYLHPVRPTKNAESLKRAEREFEREIIQYYARKEAEKAENRGTTARGTGSRGVRSLRKAMTKKNKTGGRRRTRSR
jgi:hypothetical protein